MIHPLGCGGYSANVSSYVGFLQRNVDLCRINVGSLELDIG